MKIAGFHSGHDSSYSILDDGVSVTHNELERFNRRKNSVANSMQFFLENENNFDDMDDMLTKMEKEYQIDMSANEIISVINKIDSFENPTHSFLSLIHI